MLGKKEENGSLPPPPPVEMQQVRTKKMEEKKKQIQIRESPRSPLNGLNGSSTSSSSYSSSVSSSTSSERLNRSRRGCFSFVSSHSPAAATKPRTPTTAGKKVSANPLDRTGLKNPSKLVRDRPRKQMGQAKKSQKDTVTKSGSSTRRVFRKNGGGGGCDGDVSTVITPSIPQSTPEKEGEIKKKSSSTPTDTTTPPIHASISPEIVGEGATSLAPPICFAAGHLISGIPDGRKKCRPRGILKVGVDEELGFGDSGESLATPSLVRASMQWISSPNRLDGFGCTTTTSGSDTIPVVDFTREASVDWLLPLPEHRTPRLESCSPSSGSCSWRLSPTATSTPSHRVTICRTPTSDSSISPFSMILKNAAATVSTNSWGIDNNNNRQFSSLSNIPIGDGDDGDDVILSSATPSASKNPRNSHDTNFKFDCATTASNSIDFSHFHKNAATTSAAAKASRMIESNRHEEEEEEKDQESKHDQSGFGSIELLYPDESATSSGDLDRMTFFENKFRGVCCYKDDEETSDDDKFRGVVVVTKTMR